MSSSYVYTMHKLTKRYPPDKTVLNEVTLSFYLGAKIGVLGYNGAGKSSLLKIMAGLDAAATAAGPPRCSAARAGGARGSQAAGKPSLLKIMAGPDEDSRGEAKLAPNATV